MAKVNQAQNTRALPVTLKDVKVGIHIIMSIVIVDGTEMLSIPIHITEAKVVMSFDLVEHEKNPDAESRQHLHLLVEHHGAILPLDEYSQTSRLSTESHKLTGGYVTIIITNEDVRLGQIHSVNVTYHLLTAKRIKSGGGPIHDPIDPDKRAMPNKGSGTGDKTATHSTVFRYGNPMHRENGMTKLERHMAGLECRRSARIDPSCKSTEYSTDKGRPDELHTGTDECGPSVDVPDSTDLTWNTYDALPKIVGVTDGPANKPDSVSCAIDSNAGDIVVVVYFIDPIWSTEVCEVKDSCIMSHLRIEYEFGNPLSLVLAESHRLAANVGEQISGPSCRVHDVRAVDLSNDVMYNVPEFGDLPSTHLSEKSGDKALKLLACSECTVEGACDANKTRSTAIETFLPQVDVDVTHVKTRMMAMILYLHSIDVQAIQSVNETSGPKGDSDMSIDKHTLSKV